MSRENKKKKHFSGELRNQAIVTTSTSSYAFVIASNTEKWQAPVDMLLTFTTLSTYVEEGAVISGSCKQKLNGRRVQFHRGRDNRS